MMRGVRSTITGWWAGPHEHLLTRAVLLRGLAVVYLIAFASFAWQATGLVGSGGIMPVAELMQAAKAGGVSVFRLPTLFWISSSDAAIHTVCVIGGVASVMLLAGIVPIAAAIVAWLCYLSIVTTGSDFMGFQWDALLVEAGFLAIFLAPTRLFQPGLGRHSPPSVIVIWLFRLLVFKLMFFSMVVKLATGEAGQWVTLRAMDYHYWTQPIPNPLSWYFAKLPRIVHETEVILTLIIEGVAPFGIFGPRLARRSAFVAMASLMVMIMLTGNYTFFNLLAIVLFTAILDDNDWNPWWRPRKCVKPPVATATRLPRLIVTAMLLLLILPLNVFHFTNVIGSWIKRPPRWPTPILSAYRALAPFALVNHYGLFAQMTTTRGEIILEGSDDGVTWKAYEFRYKPGDLSRRPPQIAPFQPRLDWQMWFEALSPGPDLWFARFVDRLLTNAPAVTALLAHNPFPDHPPRFIRGQMYQYRFTTIEEHRATGQWWKRTPDRLFLPPVDHETLQRVLKRSI